MPTQHITTLLSATCVAMCWVLLAQFWRWSNLHQQHPTYRNMSQQGGQTQATCCAQQCCDMLCWHVAIVWPGLKVAQEGYARSRSARQWPQSKVNILVLFAIFPIKATETWQTRAKICCSTVNSDIKALSLKLKLLKHRHFLTSVWLWFQISSISFGKIFWYAQTGYSLTRRNF